MDQDFLTPNSHGTRLYRWAWGVLALVALAQGVAVAVAMKGQAPLPITNPPKLPLTDVPASPVPAEVDPFTRSSAQLDDPHPELLTGSSPVLPEAVPVEPVLARPPIAVIAPLDVPITDEACLGHLDEGIYLRERGDMVGALAELREALDAAPDHPKLIYQLALTLDAMGQERKASEHWRKLRLLGQDAGNFYQLAVERLKEGGNLAPPGDTVFEAEEVKQGQFVVNSVKVDRMPETADGEVLHFEATIERRQAEAADVAKMDIKLHLFDEVNGRKIDRTTALPPVIQWLDAPVDWADGSERISFEYRQPPLTPDELVKLGRRKYYGYAVEFRYDGNQLQDMAAEPAMLADLARELPEGPAVPPAGELLDPAGPGSLPGQPDAVLFPGDKFDR